MRRRRRRRRRKVYSKLTQEEEDKDEDVDLFKVKAVKGEEERLYYRMCSLTIEEERSFKSANLSITDLAQASRRTVERERERELEIEREIEGEIERVVCVIVLGITARLKD